MPGQPRIVWIDAARAFAVLAVVLMHYQAYVGAPANPNPVGAELAWPWIVTQLQPIRMPLLLFMSGMLASSKLLGTDRAAAATRGVSSLYLNAVWTTVYFLASFFLVVPSPGQITSAGEWAARLVTPGSNLWFIWALAFWAFAFILLRPLPPALVLALFFFVGIVGDLTRGSLPSRLVPVLIYGIYFALGVYATKYLLRFLEHDVATKTVVLFVTYAAVHRLTQVEGLDRVLRSSLINVRSVLGLAMVAALFVLICRWKPLGKGLAFIGKRTLPLFVCHLPLLWLVMNVAPLREVLTYPGLELLWPVFGVAFLTGGSLAIDWLARSIGLRHLFEPPSWLLPVNWRRSAVK